MKTNFFIIVLYNCILKDSESFKTIEKSLELGNEKGYLYVYDNSPERQIVQNENEVWSTINYIHDPMNSGLGVAYNSGVKVATEMGFNWIVLLDQDTDFAINFISSINLVLSQSNTFKLLAPILKLKTGESFSPCRYKFKRGHSVNLVEGVYSLKKISPVNSGMVINIAAFNKVGGYDEKVKLDFADFQFIERFRSVYGEFYLLDSVGIQDFSNVDKDLNKNIFRFSIYLECAKKCNRNSLIDDFLYCYVVTRHLLALSFRFKSFVFVKLFYMKYIKG